ncbi:MAG: KpsF/GutQ family sugar-phosphate isomerase [Lentisphaeria bacterium]|nr:KpsF/GutQ family sugar-phosphate isomerase [Lentisphaeria bacterium]
MTQMTKTRADSLTRARDVMETEIAGIRSVMDSLGEEFLSLVDACLKVFSRHGKIVVTGVGKSGHVGQKIAATLASTGSPAVFMHPVEAMHGDLGMLAENDLLLALSYSGETDELVSVLPAAKRFQVPIASLTGGLGSRLAEWSDITVPMPVPREACPFNLAPTTSTTALLALGDALAIVLLERKGFDKNDYAKLHPAGAIGRAITTRVRDIMRSGDRAAFAAPETTVKEAITEMTRARSGSVMIVDKDHKLLGIFTDGDFRRHVALDIHCLDGPVSEVMTAGPTTIAPDMMAVELLAILEKRKIDDIPVVDSAGVALGLVDIQDLPKFKVM